MTQGSLKKPSAEPSSQLPGHLPQSTVSEITAWLVGQPLDAVERELIRHTLDACDGDRALTASVLGISLPALRKKMTAYAVRGKPLPVPVDHANENRGASTEPPAAGAQFDAVATAAPPEPAPEIAPEIAAEPAIAAPEPELVFESAPVPWAAPEELAAAILAAATAASAESDVAAAPVLWAAPEELAAALLSAATAASAESYFAAKPAPAEPAPPVKRPVPAAIVMPPAPPRPARRKMPSGRLIGAMGLAAVLLALIGFGMTGTNEPAKDLVLRQHPPIEMSVREKVLPFEQRIPVPAWVAGPPLVPAARTVASFDPTLDTRMELAPPPSAAIRAALVRVQGALASASIDLDTRMELAQPPSAAVRAALARAQGALASASIELDTRMDGPPQSAAMRAAIETGQGALASADIEQDARMEMPVPEVVAAVTEAAPGESETTGSIPEPTFFKAPETAPMPEVRLGAEEHPLTPPPVQRRAAPPRAPQAQARPPELPTQILFPFANIFNPKAQPGER